MVPVTHRVSPAVPGVVGGAVGVFPLNLWRSSGSGPVSGNEAGRGIGSGIET